MLSVSVPNHMTSNYCDTYFKRHVELYESLNGNVLKGNTKHLGYLRA